MDLLRHLQFFVTVAGEGHFGHAADRLGMTQPPLSQGIARLEQKLGVTLFSRGARGVGLTSAGAELLPRARALLDDAGRFEDDAQRYAQDRGALKIGLVPQLSDWHLAAVVTKVRGLGSRDVITSTMSTVELVEAVMAGRLDCGVVHHPALLNALECGRVLKVPRWFLVPEGHPAASSANPTVRALRDLPFAVAPRSGGTAAFDLFTDVLRGKGLDPKFLPAPGDRETVAAVAAGRAFGITTDPRLQAPGVARVAVSGDDFSLRTRLVWREPALPPEVCEAIESAIASADPR